MIYNPNKKIDVERALIKIQNLINKKQVFELTAKQTPKTYPQLKYLHLILGWFAFEYGETREYVKLEYFKKIVNPHIFEYEFINRKTGEIRNTYKSCADLTKDEMTMAIDRFRNYSSKEAGIYLPEPSDLALMHELEIQVKNNEQYL